MPTTQVLAAAADLPAGHILQSGDLNAVNITPAMVPDGAARGSPTSNSFLGEQLSGPLRRGEVLTDASLVGAGLLTGAPPGSQAVPLRISDPGTLRLLRQGQLVTVVLSSSATLEGAASNAVLAERVPVLWTPALAAPREGLLPSDQEEAVVVVAASPTQAVQLAGAVSRGKVFLILLN